MPDGPPPKCPPSWHAPCEAPRHPLPRLFPNCGRQVHANYLPSFSARICGPASTPPTSSTLASAGAVRCLPYAWKHLCVCSARSLQGGKGRKIHPAHNVVSGAFERKNFVARQLTARLQDSKGKHKLRVERSRSTHKEARGHVWGGGSQDKTPGNVEIEP
jgi:hypothetical protein